jgi:23S rRNA pseudouridine1911/1915/1917 synthase
VQRLIDDGHVRIRGRGVRAAYKVQGGDEIVVDVPAPAPTTVEAEPLPLTVIYEDDDVIVVDKPAGLTVHPSATQTRGTLVNALLYATRGLSGVGGILRPGIVHRLDKDTSGLLIVAKNDRAHQHLALAFKRREVDKRYFALVLGRPPARGEWAAPIGRHKTERKRFSTKSSRGKPARTIFAVETQFGHCAALSITLLTGRTHQIRVHAADAGHPLVGDVVYGGVRRAKQLPVDAESRLLIAFPRQALHAAELALTLPSGAWQKFVAPPPPDLANLLKNLQKMTVRA